MRVSVVMAAYNESDAIGSTLRALAPGEKVEVIVVDDGSDDGTAAVAEAYGARVLRQPHWGKGQALTAGARAVDARAEAVLLIDADVGDSAREAWRLLDYVMAGWDVVIGVLPPGQSGGVGVVQSVARWGLRLRTGRTFRAPLSGQRALRRQAIEQLLPFGERFGVEVAMTLRACRCGLSLVEVPVNMRHRRTGRSLAGWRHRASQLVDVCQALLGPS